ncbi:MAG: hypothetical protein J6B88_03505 [Clostridia bacterium]|nr:hypothetical protein [Clostridia bacterium]
MLNKKLSVIIPIVSAGIMYILYLIFGVAENKINMLLITPIVSLLAFWGVFLILFIIFKSSLPSAKYKTFIKYFFLICFVFYALFSGVSFIMNVKSGFSPIICICMVSCGAVAFAHKKTQK